MRPVLTFFLVLFVLVVGSVPPVGAHPAGDRKACCEAPRRATDCGGKGRPMPCCEVRPAPASTSDLPPSSVRAEAPAQAHLHLFSERVSPTVARPAGITSVHPRDLSALSDPPRLYLLHASYLI